jgi:hypothetical protein
MHFRLNNLKIAALLSTIFVMPAYAQTNIECFGDKALPLPLQISLDEANNSGTIRMQYSKKTWCQFSAEGWSYSPDEIKFSFGVDIEDCGKKMIPLEASINRKNGVLTLHAPGNKKDVAELACK